MSLFGGANIFNTSQGTPNPLFNGAPVTNLLQAQPTQPSNTNTGGGLFGSTNTAGTSTGGGLFGSTPATGSNMFGANTVQQGQTAGANANTTQPTPGGGLFGSTTNATQPATGTGLFGSTTNATQPATGTGLFGSTTNASQPATGGGLFGSTSNTTQPASGGNIFGNTANTTQPAATGGLFGSTTNAATNNTQPTATGGLFGSSTNIFANNTANANTNTNTGTTNLFGSTTTNAPGSNLFGSTTNNATGSNMFGSTTNATNPFAKPAGNLFGSTAGGGSNLFGGSTLGTSALGQQNQQQQQQQQLQPPQSQLARSMAASQQQASADPQVQFQMLVARIEAIQKAWNPTSGACRFQYPFYNLVDPKQVSLYGRPPNATDDALWTKAVQNNPDPTCLVPVIGIGFDDLVLRIDAQKAQATSHTNVLTDLSSRLTTLRTTHAASNTARLARALTTQTQLAQRLMRLIVHLHLLIPSVRSSALRPEEEALRGWLEEVQEVLRRSRIGGRVNELWALLGAVGAGVERASEVGGSGAASGADNGGWQVVDEEGLAQIAGILREEQAGLQLLTKIVQKAQRDLNVIEGRSSENNKRREEDDEGLFSLLPNNGDRERDDVMWGSGMKLGASTLR
ncbi:hypothetical protein D9619_009937 [Psilocybe cf. subviscida]|uniref:Nucleoporin Nup54 alpha-helical domain-containing protein n=1 Tax=Psilocybe cf. subviscida TaxID=2480587 RepID=A0A8H5BL43_9AGAR|nr:hypothetical protein D9619_009937 [Psilocybe cf. subviscida]